jgi:hypothetical protein
MSEYTPSEIGSALDPSVKKLIGKILSVEKEFKHIGTLSKGQEDEICSRILSAIRETAKQ